MREEVPRTKNQAPDKFQGIRKEIFKGGFVVAGPRRKVGIREGWVKMGAPPRLADSDDASRVGSICDMNGVTTMHTSTRSATRMSPLPWAPGKHGSESRG
jgi:hypothetical protein